MQITIFSLLSLAMMVWATACTKTHKRVQPELATIQVAPQTSAAYDQYRITISAAHSSSYVLSSRLFQKSMGTALFALRPSSYAGRIEFLLNQSVVLDSKFCPEATQQKNLMVLKPGLNIVNLVACDQGGAVKTEDPKAAEAAPTKASDLPGGTEADAAIEVTPVYRREPPVAMSGDAARGRELYAAQCATCHGQTAEGRGSTPPLKGQACKSCVVLQDFVQTTTATMPLGNPALCTEECATHIAAYLEIR